MGFLRFFLSFTTHTHTPIYCNVVSKKISIGQYCTKKLIWFKRDVTLSCWCQHGEESGQRKRGRAVLVTPRVKKINAMVLCCLQIIGKCCLIDRKLNHQNFSWFLPNWDKHFSFSKTSNDFRMKFSNHLNDKFFSRAWWSSK